MADPPRYSDAGHDTAVGADHESSIGTPRWVKVFGIMAIVVVLLFGIMLIAGGGHHGPGRHRHTSGPPGGEALAATVTGVGVLSEFGDL
jgi:hypothetical protein